MREGKLGELFDEAPLIVPLPDDPDFDEAPAVLVKSSAGHVLKIARKRIDLIIGTRSNEEAYDNVRAVLLEHAEGLHGKLMAFFKKHSNKINRFGFLATFFYKHEAPEAIIARLLATNPKEIHGGGGFKHCLIRYGIEDKLVDMNIHNLTTFQAAKFTPKEGVDGKMGIKLDRDFNTIEANDEYDFGWQNIYLFLESAEKKFLLEEVTKDLWK